MDDHEDIHERAEFHHDQFLSFGNLDDLEKAIEYGNRVVGVTPMEHPRMPARFNCLGAYYDDRFRELGNLDDMEKSMECIIRALGLTPEDHPKLPLRLSNLGVSYTVRFQRLGHLEDLQKSMDYKSRALELTPEGHPDLPDWHAALAVSYADRYRRLGGLDDLEKWVESDSLALKLTQDDHPELSERHANMGVSYGVRYQRLGKIEDLEKAIESGSCALALTPEGHPDLPDRHADLGASYGNRYRRLGEPGDLDKWIECDSRALALTPNGHPALPRRYANLGASYADRYKRLQEFGDLEMSIIYKARALALTPDDHPDLAHRNAALGVSYTYRYQYLDELADLENSIKYKVRALELTSDNHPDLPDRYTNLGVSYGERYKRLLEPGDLEKAIEFQHQAVAFTPEGHPELSFRHFNQAILFHNKYKSTFNSSHLHSSLASFRKASQVLTGAPRDTFNYALRWAKLASENSYLEPIEAFHATMDLLHQFIWLGATTTQRYQDLLLAENVAVQAACAAILSSKYALALEWLEHARCVVWNQSLMLRSPLESLALSHPALASQLQSVAQELHHANSGVSESHSSAVVPEQRHRLARRYIKLLTQTRKIPGFGDFLLPTKANELVRAARNGPIVVINCHGGHCDALLILPGQEYIDHIALPSFTEQKTRSARSELETWLRRGTLEERGVRRPLPEPETNMGLVLVDLWYDIVKPVLSHLNYLNKYPIEHLPHVTWCPTGPLSFLPLHAAGDYDQPRSRVFDHVISSYTPTLTALLASTPTVLDRVPGILAISQAATPGHSPLPGTTRELSYIKTHTEDKAVYSEFVGDRATTIAVLDAMEQHDWVHLACHAHQNVSDPTKSGFFLHDGTLDLAAINQKSFTKKGLAFLSACQTATGDEKLPDEAIHLASGMLMAGYSSVIATMWSVADDDAPFIADKVYALLMQDGKIANGEAGKALHYAVAELREMVGEKEFGRWVPYIHVGS
ncbi:hypothetical protein BN14_08829 [Rhizoctonia solani AG-1 IB]|uniref:CHAT domain-containing protein n=1 Tax=Thanatephorus cucumeris (strain AG1-IB / isolate 7/3/14) TaxID=1108050 RepID=M5CFG1_THACB|nr:hypothetical protein BN14_08829 [Rhizoctonia solani AG-1 IB]